MASARIQIRGDGFITDELIARLSARPAVNGKLVQVFAETLHFASGLLSRLPVSKQETSEEKQKVIALLMLLRLVEIGESTLILAAHGVRQELHSMFRIFLDAYFLVANVCSDPAFVPIYFRTDEPARLKLMNVASKHDDELFKVLNDYATADIKDELDRKIKQERIEAFNSFVFAERVGCDKIYDSKYRLCSASIHTGPRCLEEYVEVDEQGAIRVMIHSGDTETTHRVLYDMHCFLVKAVGGVCEVFSLAEEAALSEFDKAREAAIKDIEL